MNTRPPRQNIRPERPKRKSYPQGDDGQRRYLQSLIWFHQNSIVRASALLTKTENRIAEKTDPKLKAAAKRRAILEELAKLDAQLAE